LARSERAISKPFIHIGHIFAGWEGAETGTKAIGPQIIAEEEGI
jgi:hypothetical protein